MRENVRNLVKFSRSSQRYQRRRPSCWKWKQVGSVACRSSRGGREYLEKKSDLDTWHRLGACGAAGALEVAMRAMRKILYLAANPVGTGRLGLDQEYRGIRCEIERGKYSRRFELMPCLAIPSDLPQELRRHKPVAVHFSCHGYH